MTRKRSLKANVAVSLAATIATLLPGASPCQEVSASADSPSRTYALIAVLGEQLDQVVEVRKIGSHLSPYKHSYTDVPNDLLNRVALHSLDMGIEKIAPASKRIYMTLPPAELNWVPPAKRESVAMSRVIAALQNSPQRMDWYRIVVITPSFEAASKDGMAPKSQGFGIFSESQCQAGCGPGGGKVMSPVPWKTNTEPMDGVDAITHEGRPIKAQTFIAPFSYIQVWVLDPRTLEVLDRQRGLDHQKLAESVYRPVMDNEDYPKYVAGRFANLLELSVGDALLRSEVNAPRGQVHDGPIRVVPPEELTR